MIRLLIHFPFKVIFLFFVLTKILTATTPINIVSPSICYRTHVQDYGWQEGGMICDGLFSGTIGESKRIEAIMIIMAGLYGCQLSYRVHAADIGWMDWVTQGQIAGTVGELRRLEAIQIQLDGCYGFDVIYRVYAADIGWMDWVKNGEMAGTTGELRRIEGIAIKLEKYLIAPFADFTVSPHHGESSLSVTLDASKSVDYLEGGSIIRYDWSASDGQTASGKQATMIFTEAGIYTISLVVVNDRGVPSASVAQKEVTVVEPEPVPTVPPVAKLTVSPKNGEAPLTVSLDGSSSFDSDGYIVEYAWVASDGQPVFGSIQKITFYKSGTYIITLTVRDNDGLAANAQETITVAPPTTEEAPITKPNVAHLEFRALKDFYKVGETVVMELIETVNRDKYTRVDLWMAVELPSREFLFRTDIPLNPWSPMEQPHKTSIENTETSHYIFDFELPEGMGGDYTLYAVYVKEGENPISNGFSHRSNLLIRQIFLANRKE